MISFLDYHGDAGRVGDWGAVRVQGPVRGGPVCHAKPGGDSVLREDDKSREEFLTT